MNGTGYLTTRGSEFRDGTGAPTRLRGVGLGGWMNMENFITGYPANESHDAAPRSTRCSAPSATSAFFDRLLDALLRSRRRAAACRSRRQLRARSRSTTAHFEDDDRPFELREDGFRLSTAPSRLCAAHGIYTVIDLHAVPGCQNQHWHSDNPTHSALFWEHPHFQDRVVHLWEAIADRYRDDAWVGGLQPAQRAGRRERRGRRRRSTTGLWPRSARSTPTTSLFLDGNTYSTDFVVFAEPVRERRLHLPRLRARPASFGGPYPGRRPGVWCDATAARAEVPGAHRVRARDRHADLGRRVRPGLHRRPANATQQRYADPRRPARHLRPHGAGWSLWTYKDIGLQGLVTVSPDTPYQRHFGPIVAKKARLGTDRWTTSGTATAPLTEPVHQLIAEEFPDFDPYPWGARDWVTTRLNHGMFAEPMVDEYATAFAGLDDSELIALADSFALSNCVLREPLAQRIRDHCSSPTRPATCP